MLLKLPVDLSKPRVLPQYLLQLLEDWEVQECEKTKRERGKIEGEREREKEGERERERERERGGKKEGDREGGREKDTES